jgi:hypothetical protein
MKKEHCKWLCLGEENRVTVKVKVKVNKNVVNKNIWKKEH